MNLPVQWGDVPAWIALLSSWTKPFVEKVMANRAERIESWPSLVEKLSGLNEGEVGSLIDQRPEVAELIWEAWEAAARSASEDKRYLLASVVARGLRAMDDVVVDMLPFFLRTVEALEPLHIRLLNRIGAPAPGIGSRAGTRLEGCVTTEDVSEALQDNRDLTHPLLGALVREGLVIDRAVGTWDYAAAYDLTEYGDRFLDFLAGTEPWVMQRDAAELALRLQTDQLLTSLVIKNLGPATATDLEVVIEDCFRFSDSGEILAAESLSAPKDSNRYASESPLKRREEIGFPFMRPLAKDPPYAIEVHWRDARGRNRRKESLPSGTPLSD